MFVKVCGITSKEQVDKAIDFGFDAIGIVTDNRSPRYCDTKKALDLLDCINGRVKSFVVGFEYENVREVASDFDYVQIYKLNKMDDISNLVIASKEPPPKNINYEYFIYDASMGRGVFEEYPSWLNNLSEKLLLAGGLNNENVCEATQTIKSFGIDVSSSLEKNGIKNLKLMKEFITTIRNC